MAFFGLTALGPQNVFKDQRANLFSIRDIEDIFFEAAFDDHSEEGLIESAETRFILTKVYHDRKQDVPELEMNILARKIEQIIENESKLVLLDNIKLDEQNHPKVVTKDQFMQAIGELRSEIEEKTQNGANYISHQKYTHAKTKNMTKTTPRRVFRRPVTTNNDLGWRAVSKIEHTNLHKVGHIPQSEMTKFADCKIRSEFF